MDELTVVAPEDKTMVAIAHLSGLSGYVIPLGGAIVPLVLWLTAKSPMVATVAKQALWLNAMAYVGVILGVLSYVTLIGIPCAIIWWAVLAIAVVVLPIMGAIKAMDGRYYRYPLIGFRP